MFRSNFIIDYVSGMHYICHKINTNCSGSNRDSPIWIYKKATINPKDNHGNCFQYAIIIALNHDQIKRNPQNIKNIFPFIDHYNWKDKFSNANFPCKRMTNF